MRILAVLCLTFLSAVAAVAQVDADMVAKRRLFAPVGPGLKQIREGADGKIYVLASPFPGLVVYSPEARRLLTMHEASALPEAALAEAKASGEVLVQYGEDCDVDPDGTIYVTINELKDPAGLQSTLRADGVPASVTFFGPHCGQMLSRVSAPPITSGTT